LNARYQSEAIGLGLASAILLGTFGGEGGPERIELEGPEARVLTARPELELWRPPGAWGKRYWFGTKPTLNKLVVQYRNA
jgi:hypothetical protein